MKKILELFSGTESISKIFKSHGWKCITVDNNPKHNCTHNMDIFDFDTHYEHFDVIWASPPCTTFSVASIGTHWGGGKCGYIPKTEKSKQGIEIIRKTISIIHQSIIENRNLKFFIENPRGLLRKMHIMKEFEYGKDTSCSRKTVTYCQYGDTRMKPTDIWTNCDVWQPKPMCKNGDSCHVSAPRGSKTGTQGLDKVDRSRIPKMLCEEIFNAVVGAFTY